MLTATFFEDAVRIITEFTPQVRCPSAWLTYEQYNYLVASRGVASVISYAVLILSIVLQLGGSVSIIAQYKTSWAVGALISVLIMQATAFQLLLLTSYV